MMNKYSKWNNTSYYPNCNRTWEESCRYNTEKILYSTPVELLVTAHYTRKDYDLDDIQRHSLIRVAASHGLVRQQLKKYLIMQGFNIDNFFDDKLNKMVQAGYLTSIKISNMLSSKNITLYDLGERGIEELKNMDIAYRNPASEYAAGGDAIRYMRSCIVSNQIALQMMISLRSMRRFFFRKIIRLKNDNTGVITPLLFQLYIQTDENNYAFEMACDTKSGKDTLKNKLDRLYETQDMLIPNTIIVIVAETYDHMKKIAEIVRQYKNKGLKLDFIFTHDSEWYYNTMGKCYAEARALGCSELIGVNLI